MLKTLLVITSLFLTIGVNAQQRNTGVKKTATSRTTKKATQAKTTQTKSTQVRSTPVRRAKTVTDSTKAVSAKPMSAIDSGYPYEPDSLGYIVRVGQKAPDFTLSRLDDKTFTLSKNRGKVVLLQFTASWCGVCRTAMKEALEPKLWKKLKRHPRFVMIGIDCDEPVESVGKFVRETGITYPMALDTNAEAFEKYAEKGSGVTRNVLIGKNGKIVKLTRLYDEKEFDALVKAIRAELAK
jgi:peroxiredoxin